MDRAILYDMHICLYLSARYTHNTDNTGLPRDALAAPSEVTRVETESTVLEVTTTDTNGVDTLGTDFGTGGLTTELELPVFAIVGALGTGVRTLVPGGTGDTWI